MTGLTDGRLILSDRSKGTVVRTINAHKAAVTDVEFSLDGATIFLLLAMDLFALGRLPTARRLVN